MSVFETGALKLQDWILTDGFARVDIAGRNTDGLPRCTHTNDMTITQTSSVAIQYCIFSQRSEIAPALNICAVYFAVSRPSNETPGTIRHCGALYFLLY